MLTTSPIVASSANASPNSFHYAPTRSSPHSSPARLSAPLPRRHSASRSSPSAPMTSPSSQPRSRQYVAVDAGTQYSPMESSTQQQAQDAPVDVANAPRAAVPAAPVEPPQTPCPQPIEPSAPHSSPGTQSQLHPQPQAVVAPVIRDASAIIASPGKRRNSQDPAAAQAASASAGGESSSSAAKRPKPTAGPPKILPQRYEFCGVEDMVVLISHMLSELIETNDALALRSGSLTRFHSR
ncbi:Nuc-1 negative regulatory protein preg [Colletotrichum tanaceti]|nr:Nuc-1 negative regulatory protein preg [Colletotrichum tanaceti]